jgi:hypothetical protein
MLMIIPGKPKGVMSVIDTFVEAMPPGPSPYASEGGAWPVHCATEMEIVVPAVGASAVDYTFEPEEGPVRLPPVWRCSCGFQLDAWAAGWTKPAESLTPEHCVPVLAGTFPA